MAVHIAAGCSFAPVVQKRPSAHLPDHTLHGPLGTVILECSASCRLGTHTVINVMGWAFLAHRLPCRKVAKSTTAQILKQFKGGSLHINGALWRSRNAVTAGCSTMATAQAATHSAANSSATNSNVLTNATCHIRFHDWMAAMPKGALRDLKGPDPSGKYLAVDHVSQGGPTIAPRTLLHLIWIIKNQCLCH